jgi:high mobility group protein B3
MPRIKQSSKGSDPENTEVPVKITSKKNNNLSKSKKGKKHYPVYEYTQKWLTDNKASQKLINAWEKDESKLNKFLKQQEKKQQSKKAKDPNRPKRPLSAYMVYCNRNREKVKEENPGIEVKTTMVKLGAGWRSLSDKQRTPYIKKAAELKAIYEKEMENYIPPDGKKVDKDKPKKPWSNYIFFCQEKRSEAKNQENKPGATEFLKDMGKMWNELSESQKEPYNKKAEKAKAEYEKAMDAYNKKKGKNEANEKKEKAESKRKKKKTESSEEDEMISDDE